jgi:CRISPR/Cas system-associated protein Cas5 (RAMP superfamily)
LKRYDHLGDQDWLLARQKKERGRFSHQGSCNWQVRTKQQALSFWTKKYKTKTRPNDLEVTLIGEPEYENSAEMMLYAMNMDHLVKE